MAMTPLTGLDRTSPTFKTDLDTFFLSSLPQFVTEANALETAVDADRVAAAGSAIAAAASSVEAGSHADAARASANQAQDSAQAALAILAVNVAPAFVSGQTVAIGDPRYSLVNFQTYRAKTAGAHTADPSADSVNWAAIGGGVSVSKTYFLATT